MASLAQRMKEAMELRNISQAEIVKRTGIGKSSISTYLSGEYEPKQRNIYKICEVLNVNEAWLMGYDVPIERHPTQLNNPTVTTDMEFKDIIKNRNKELDFTSEGIENAVRVAKDTNNTKIPVFNKKLNELRIKNNLSQQNLADIIGISKSSINMYERGEREPNFSTLVSFADFFNVDINYLLGYETSFSDIEFCLIESFRKNKDMQAAILKLLDITKL